MEPTHLTLAGIWFFLWGLLWAVYFALDGFDLGAGTLMPFLAKNEREKRIVFNAAGPFWDGNEVWLIAAGGVTFAAFPQAYATLFSGLYTALMLLLFALILRGVSFEFRSKVDNPAWKGLWDACQVAGSFLPALLLGVAFANLFRGLPLDANHVNQGGLLDLLNPFGLAGGVLFVLMFCLHGAIWIAARTQGELQERAVRMAGRLWPFVLGIVVLFLAFTAVSTRLFGNYMKSPILFAVPLLAAISLVAARLFLARKSLWPAFGASALFIVCVTFFGVIGLFPALIQSWPNPGNSLTIHNAASSQLTLTIMLVVAVIFVPVVIAYQAWSYKNFAHTLSDADLDYPEAY